MRIVKKFICFWCGFGLGVLLAGLLGFWIIMPILVGIAGAVGGLLAGLIVLVLAPFTKPLAAKLLDKVNRGLELQVEWERRLSA